MYFKQKKPEEPTREQYGNSMQSNTPLQEKSSKNPAPPGSTFSKKSSTCLALEIIEYYPKARYVSVVCIKTV